ncbi:hypothetical protein PAMP_012900 [Pampus punctatissimus]
MERGAGSENESSSSQQNTMWKQLQAKAKPLLSPKLGARESGGGMWMFKKIKRKENVMDRVISSSQPDLIFSSQVDVETKEAQLYGKAAGSDCAVGREKPQYSSKQASSSQDKPTVAHLVQSHHKSSSLGSACLEKVTEPPGSGGGGEAAAAAEEQLETEDEPPIK